MTRSQHAIALLRGRNASAQDKRSAVVALAHVLERRRSLLKAELLSSDEGVVVRVANEIAIRHENEKQRSDDDLVFLEVFWWYLATIELTGRQPILKDAEPRVTRPGVVRVATACRRSALRTNVLR